MSDRVIVTAGDDLADVLRRLDDAAARFGWRVVVPADAEHIETRARADVAAHRLPRPLVVRLEPLPDAPPVDTMRLLGRAPVAGVVADDAERRPDR